MTYQDDTLRRLVEIEGDMLVAGAGAVGLLQALLDAGYVPGHHRPAAAGIIKRFNDASNASVALAREPAPTTTSEADR